ncbi:MAG: hypothetical protein KC933_09200 [Myxococcales bacterium]|nr:hypothetical protein [Myxococcales bacterium]
MSLKPPEITGLRLTKMTPGSSNEATVKVPIELKIKNPNEKELEIQADRIRIVTREGDSERVLGVGAFASPVVVGPGGENSNPQLVETTLAVDRDSWDRGIFTKIRSGEAFVTGPVKVLYGGKTYETTLDLRLPGRDADPTGESAKVLALDTKLEKLRFAFTSLSEFNVKAELAAKSEIGQPITLKDVVMTIGAKNSKKPLKLTMRKEIELPADKEAIVELDGDADLETCDPTLLDDIEAAGRVADVRIVGVASSPGFPDTDFDEQVDVTFPGADSGEKGPEVELVRPELALFTDVVGGSQQSSSLVDGLGTISKLTSFQETPVNFSLQNPIPGTMKITVSDVILLGPYNPDKKRRLEVVSMVMKDQSLAPRAKSDVQATLQLLKDGGKVWKAVAVDASNHLLTDYCLSTSWQITLPVFGEIKSDKSFGPVYSDSNEDCSRR